MAKKKAVPTATTSQSQDDILIEVLSHYTQWTEDSDMRRTRKNGWNDITDAYWGKLPADWPYNSKVVDPRIRTTIIEKDARLLNNKLRGRLVPREGGDIVKARIQNAILDYQWDTANENGTMLSKWKAMSQDTRLYGSRFGLVKWRHEEKDGKIVFDGNEFTPLDVRDSGMDSSCEHVRGAKWFQAREWAVLADLDRINDLPSGGKLYPGLDELKQVISENASDRRDSAYENRILGLKGLEDRTGGDKSFQIVELVTEYRKDRWITFSPRHRVILRDIPNPYVHGKIPVIQLRYYKLTGDPLGESEVEPVLPLWRAIQANLCGYLDTMNNHMRPPLKIVDGQVRIETIAYGPEAQWIVNNPDAVTEMTGSGEPMQYFQTTHSALVAAFNTAMGDASQGVSSVDPFNPQKTATEIKATMKQQNSRDQDNQNQLAEALEDMMSMWLSNNQQFIFADEKKSEFVIRIVGSELFQYFKKAGFDELEVTPETMQMIGDIITSQGGNVSDEDILHLIMAGETPRFPIFDNPNEKDPSKLEFKPKMRVGETGDVAELSILPEDLDGYYDYVADVASMAAGADQMRQEGIQSAVQLLTTNPQVLQLLQQEGIKPKIKDLLISSFEQAGLNDAERFFEQSNQGQNGTPPAAVDPSTGLPQPIANNGVSTNSTPNTPALIPSQTPQPIGLSQ